MSTQISIPSLESLQELVLLLRGLDNTTVDFPVHVWWFNNMRHWVVNTGQYEKHRRWYMDDAMIRDFDHDYRRSSND